MKTKNWPMRFVVAGLMSVLGASCAHLQPAPQVLTKPEAVALPRPVVPDRLRQSCLVDLPSPADNGQLALQRAQALAMAKCEHARAAELLRLLTED